MSMLIKIVGGVLKKFYCCVYLLYKNEISQSEKKSFQDIN